MPLTSILKEIERQTDFKFFYKQQLLKNAGNVSIDTKNASLETVLALCFSNQPIEYKIVNKQIVLSPKQSRGKDKIETDNSDVSTSSDPQAVRIWGFVLGSNNQPLAGATVRVRAQKTVTQTNEKGAFYLLANPNSLLQVSYVGHSPAEKEPLPIVLLSSNSSPMLCLMMPWCTTDIKR